MQNSEVRILSWGSRGFYSICAMSRKKRLKREGIARGPR